MTAVAELAGSVGTVAACAALGVSRATVYWKRAPKEKVPKPRATNPRALAAAERQQDGPSAARFNFSATLISGRRCLAVSDTIRAESWGHVSHAGRLPHTPCIVKLCKAFRMPADGGLPCRVAGPLRSRDRPN